jgi:probable F420-dependent oxidoreductase
MTDPMAGQESVAMQPDPPVRRSAAMAGTMGVWLGQIAMEPAQIEREAVGEIENLGFGTVWVGENERSREAFAHAGVLLAATSTLTVATGVANIWARDAFAMNAGACTLAEAYPRRFILGIGVSHAAQVDVRNHAYRRAYSRMACYVDEMNAGLYAAPAPQTRPPLLLAALGPRMIRLARDAADGVHTYLVTPQHTESARSILGPEPFLAPAQTVILETDSERARQAGRKFLSFYLALPNYVRSMASMGFEQDDFAAGGSDRLVDAMVAWGDLETIRSRVRAHVAAGADHVAVRVLPTDDLSALEQLRRLAPALCG